jgi:hypothetical protein
MVENEIKKFYIETFNSNPLGKKQPRNFSFGNQIQSSLVSEENSGK